MIELLDKGLQNYYFSFGSNGITVKEYISDYLIANGVIVPPCKVGQTVWCIVEGFDYLMEGRVRRFTIGENWINIYCGVKGYYEQVYTDRDIGKTVFLTREEAEQKLVNYKSSKNDVERKEDEKNENI